MNYASHLRKMASDLRTKAAFLDEVAQNLENQATAQTLSQAKLSQPAHGVVNTTASLRRG